MKRIGLILLSGITTLGALGGLQAAASADEHKVETRRIEQPRVTDDDCFSTFDRWTRSEEYKRFVSDYQERQGREEQAREEQAREQQAREGPRGAGARGPAARGARPRRAEQAPARRGRQRSRESRQPRPPLQPQLVVDR
jgi:hypothetical protein